jgi:hypothetical protein
MTRSLGVKVWATGTLVLVAGVACANSGSNADPPASPTSSSVPSFDVHGAFVSLGF